MSRQNQRKMLKVHSKKLRKRNLSLLLVMMVTGLSGCLKIPPSGVSVKSATADLVFGVPPVVEDVLPPGFEEPPAQFFTSPPPTKKVVNPTPTPKVDKCPTASDQTFPELEATTEVVGHPRAGLYTWKWAGRHKNPVNGEESPFGPFIIRALGNVTPGDSLNFEFSTLEYEFNVDSRTQQVTFAVVVQTFKVVQTGSEDHGIFLERVARHDNEEDTTPQVFRPEPPVLLSELPIKVPMEINSAGVDPETLAALTVKGQIKGRKRLDACGTVLDSWYFETEEQFTSATGANFVRKFNYAIVPQFGGPIAYEYDEAPPAQANQEPVIKYESNVGYIEPLFLPDYLKKLLK